MYRGKSLNPKQVINRETMSCSSALDGHEMKFKFVRIRKIRNTILNRNTSNNLEFNRDDASRK